MIVANSSYWELDTYLSKADYLIIGAGITGLNAAITLKLYQPGARVVVVDGDSRGGGASYRNAGFACIGSPTELLDDMAHIGLQSMTEIATMRWNGLQELRNRVGESAMEYTACGGVELFTDTEADLFHQVATQLPELNRIFKDLTGQSDYFTPVEATNGFRNLSGMIEIANEGRIHPGKMMAALFKMAQQLGIEYLGGIKIQGIESSVNGVQLITEDGKVLYASRVGLATNGFTQRLFPELEVIPARNQVYLTDPIPDLKWDKCVHYHQGYVYARRIGDRLLIGGARHLEPHSETTMDPGFSAGIEVFLHDFAFRHLGLPEKAVFTGRWSGTMGVGPIKAPIIAALDNNIFGAVRLGGMGIAIGTRVGSSLADKMMA
jgi:glycine/D-amino acid oxidase-like deaminating enzyme